MRTYKTQMEAAKKGIITPEMKTVAEKEYTDPEQIRQLVALGQVAIPANINHKSLCAEGIGKDVEMIIGNGYTKNHAKITLDVLRESEKLRKLFDEKYV